MVFYDEDGERNVQGDLIAEAIEEYVLAKVQAYVDEGYDVAQLRDIVEEAATDAIDVAVNRHKRSQKNG